VDEIAGLIEAQGAPASFRYALFERVNPEQNESRFYYVSWQATLFDEGAVVRLWGRTGEWQREMASPFPTLDEAWPLLRRVMRSRLRRGYRVVEAAVDGA
jgi:predicted DNA-binding WGR domain protein